MRTFSEKHTTRNKIEQIYTRHGREIFIIDVLNYFTCKLRVSTLESVKDGPSMDDEYLMKDTRALEHIEHS